MSNKAQPRNTALQGQVSSSSKGVGGVPVSGIEILKRTG